MRFTVHPLGYLESLKRQLNILMVFILLYGTAPIKECSVQTTEEKKYIKMTLHFQVSILLMFHTSFYNCLVYSMLSAWKI